MGGHRIGAGLSSFHGRRRRPLYNARRFAAGTMAAGGDGRNARLPVAARLPGRPAPRRPGAMSAPRPAGRTPPTQQCHPRAKQEAGARRGRPLREVHKISVLCAPRVHKTHILLTYQGGRAAERRNPTPGGSGAAAPALVGGGGLISTEGKPPSPQNCGEGIISWLCGQVREVTKMVGLNVKNGRKWSKTPLICLYVTPQVNKRAILLTGILSEGTMCSCCGCLMIQGIQDKAV